MTMIDQILKIIPRIGLANCKMNQIICYYLPPSAAVMPLIRPKLKTLDNKGHKVTRSNLKQKDAFGKSIKNKFDLS